MTDRSDYFKPSYYAIIPGTVRYNKNITPQARLLYGEITALCNKEGFCYAGNEYFAKLYNVTEITISRWIKQLRDEKEIFTYIDKRTNHRIITLEENQLTKLLRRLNKNDNSHLTKLLTAINKNVKSNNNTTNNTTKNKNKIVFPFDSDDFKKLWNLWKEYRQEQHNFKYKSPVTEQAALDALNRRSEGIEDTAINLIKTAMSRGWRGFFTENNIKDEKTPEQKFAEFKEKYR